MAAPAKLNLRKFRDDEGKARARPEGRSRVATGKSARDDGKKGLKLCSISSADS